MLKYLLVALLVLCTFSPTFAGTWSELAPVPIAEQNTSYHVMVHDGHGSLFLTGGFVFNDRTTESGGFRASREFFRYSTSSNTWSRVADTPDDMFANGGIYDGKGHILMNCGEWSDKLYAYDIASNSWTQKASAPVGMKDDFAAFDGNDGVFFADAGSNNVYRYSISGDSWTLESSIPEPMRAATFAYDSGKLYLTVGQRDWTDPVSSHFYSYDLQSSSWTQMADTPVPMAGGTAFADLNGGIVVTAGWGSQDYRGLYRYDTLGNTWSRLDTQELSVGGMARHAVAYDGLGSVYYTEGSGVGPRTELATNRVFRYDLTPVPEPSSAISLIIFGLGFVVAKGRGK